MNTYGFKRYLTLALISVLLLISVGTFEAQAMQQAHHTRKFNGTIGPNSFVRRSGTQLMLNGHPFRFVGANIYWLGLDENVDGIDYPTYFRVKDVFNSALAMGLTVVRSHTLGISVGCSLCLEPSLGIFNSEAFKHLDYAIEAANEAGIRLIIPLTDNWHYYQGGKHTFTDWRGVPEDQFYTNSIVIGDFEQYISTLLNHINSYTGIAYKDDPTILAWETGNELQSPVSWTQQIASFIKHIDTHHLVADGNYEHNMGFANFAAYVSHATSVDVYTGHYYPLDTRETVLDAALAQKAGKAFFVGEYDWTGKYGGDSLSSFQHIIENDPAISGDLFWSLFAHDDMGRLVQHFDGYTLHYPGDDAAMQQSITLIMLHAVRMRTSTETTGAQKQ